MVEDEILALKDVNTDTYRMILNSNIIVVLKHQCIEDIDV